MTFDALGIAGSGMTAGRKWIDAISDNLANINNASGTADGAFKARFVEAQAGPDQSGVYVKAGLRSNTAPREVYDPTNPLANADGNVYYPEIDMASQMGYLIMAQRGYQANAAVVDRARDTYLAALQIGKN